MTDQVADDLGQNQDLAAPPKPQGDHVEEREGVGTGDEEIEGIDPGQGLGDGLHVDRNEEEGGDHHHPKQHQAFELAVELPVHGLPRPDRLTQCDS